LKKVSDSIAWIWVIYLSEKEIQATSAMAKNTARPKTLADCAAERGLKALWGALDAV